MKPCYIHGKQGMQIRLDGPALSVDVPGQSAVLTPLSRISRIVVSGSPDCSVAALLACAEQGITITFLQHDGAVRAQLFGNSKTRGDLFTHLRDLLDRPDWPEHYQLWLESSASRARCALCRKLGLQPDRSSGRRLSSILSRQMDYLIDPGKRGYLQRRLRGLCVALVNEVLQQAGLDATRCRYLEQHLDIPGDFANLLALSLQLPLIDWLKRQSRNERIDDRDVVALFERNSKRLENIARRLTSRLHGFLIDLT